MVRNKWAIFLGSITLFFGIFFIWGFLYWNQQNEMFVNRPVAQPLLDITSQVAVKDKYDVIVVGTDPEGVIAAVSAARNGLKTLLVDGRNRAILGGLATLGGLNSLDMNPGPNGQILNKGMFSEWYKMIEGDSFDVNTAANAFNKMVTNEPNIELLLKTKAIVPLVKKGADGGIDLLDTLEITLEDGSKRKVIAKSIIDATQDADIAAAAGVPWTFGREDLGDKEARMAVTLVFRLTNVTTNVWKQIYGKLQNDGNIHTGASLYSAWGYSELYNYQAKNPTRVKMRGLNIGRQNDDTILINALQIFGINGLDPSSVSSAFDIGKQELPFVVDYIKETIPELSGVELGGTSPELYVRESRHIIGEYRLTMLDVLENRDQWDRIAFGSYPVDIQRLSPSDNGAVVSQPIQYAIAFRSIVPKKVDGLLVVGRSASFDTLPHGSARVIPVGMATGEAAGAAAKISQDLGITFRQLSASKEAIKTMQELLTKQGMDLQKIDIPDGDFMKHRFYAGLQAVISMGLVIGGYDNNGFRMDVSSNEPRFINLMNGVRKVHSTFFKGPAMTGRVVKDITKEPPLSLQLTTDIIANYIGLKVAVNQGMETLKQKGYLKEETINLITNPKSLTNAETYMLVRDVVANLTGKIYK